MRLIAELVLELGLGVDEIHRLIATAPKRYKVYTVPKRRGGFRIIAQPASEVKFLQRYLLEHKLSRLPVHASATGYVRGRNIRENADAHRHNKAILKLDFRNFFPSIKAADWQQFAQHKATRIIAPEDLPLYTQILFWGQRSDRPVCLSIGAPTSPALSNILMFDLDSEIDAVAGNLSVVYTRYADDITASAMSLEALHQFEVDVRAIVRRSKSPRLLFNDEKRGIYLRGQRRMVTGLIITPTSKISIGRQRKRLISTLIHRAKLGQLDVDKLAQLKGLLGFCAANEPEFIGRMRRKYGSPIVDTVMRYYVPRKRSSTALR